MHKKSPTFLLPFSQNPLYLTLMKMRLAILSFVLIAFMSSCTREYICQCKIKYTGPVPGLPDSSIVEFKIKNTRQEAQTQCKANSLTSTKDGVTLIEECQLY